jgi:hypothetical protein
MIPQPFIKGAGERVYFGQYEYPLGADIIFDFGNPLCTVDFTSANVVYNVGSASLSASLVPYNNPGPIYPSLAGGVAQFASQATTDGSYMEWNWKSTAEQTNIFVYQPAVGAGSGSFDFPGGYSVSDSSIYVEIDRAVPPQLAGYATPSGDLFPGTRLNVDTSNGRNGWNNIIFQADSSNYHALYLNATTPTINTDTIARSTSGIGTVKFPWRVNTTANGAARIMAFLQYPRLLTPKEIRQINKVFAQRYFL